MDRIWLVLALGMILAGCGGGGGNATGTVTGTVQDSDSQAPIENATMSVVGTTIQESTNAQGHYSLPNVPAGARTVRAEATGYFAQSHNVDVPANSTATVDFQLTPQSSATGTVTGTVRDSGSQAPIAGATMSVVGTTIQASTDAQGYYTLANVPAGARTVRAEATGYFAQSQNVDVPADSAATVDFQLSLQSSGVIDVWPGGSIQQAVDQALPGQTVLIHAGTYMPSSAGEALVVVRAEKNGITIRGAGSTADEVVLDGNHQVLHVIFMDEGLDRNTVVENLTVTGGYAYPATVLPPGYTPLLRPDITDFDDDFYNDGSGLMLFVCAPIVRNCRIVNNEAHMCGGGISVFWPGGDPFPNPGPFIFGNEIINNAVNQGTGGGVDLYTGARAEVVNNLLIGNSGWGGAIAVLDSATATVDFNTIVGNHGSISGLATMADSTTNLTNTIFAGNLESAPLLSNGTFTYSHCCFWNNVEEWSAPPGQGHVTTDPLFVPGPRGAYYLSQTPTQAQNSPCVNAGSEASAGSAVENLTTRTDGVADSGQVDMGYHYHP